MSTEPIDIKVNDKISGNIAKKLTDIGTAASSSFNAVEELKAALEGFSAIGEMTKASRDAAELRAEIANATQAVGALAESAKGAAGGLDTASDSAEGLANRLDEVDVATKSVNNSGAEMAQMFNRAALALGAFIGGRQLISMASQWSDMQSRVGAAIKDMERAPEMMQRLVDVADASYAPLSQTVEIYGRNVAVLDALGYSADQAADFTEALNHALVITATKGQDADVVLNALSRSIAIGGLRQLEFETIMSRSPRVLEAVAEAMGTNIVGLRDLAAQGMVTGEVIVDALIGGLDQLSAEAEAMPATIEDAFMRLNNALLEFIGTTDQANGVSTVLVGVLEMVRENIGTVVGAAALFMAAWGVTGVIGIVLNVISAFSSLIPVLASLGALIIAHPIMFLAVALTAAALAVAYMTGNLDGLVDALKKGVADIMGLNTESETLADTIETNDQVATAFGDQLVRFGDEGAPAIGEADGAAFEFSRTLDTGAESAANLASNLWEAVAAAKALNSARSSSSGESSSSDVPGYAKGADFMVGGRTGVDRNLVAFRASRGERVKVQTPQQQRDEARGRATGGNNYTLNVQIVTPDADSFRASKQQLSRDLAAVIAAGEV